MQVALKPIAGILKSNYLGVPPFQRPYAWGVDNVRQLMEDVNGNIGQEGYFIGTVVTSAQNGEAARLRVIDGQQRLATVLIMLAAAQDRFAEIGDIGSAEELSPYLSSKNLATKIRSPKLEMSDQDNIFFRARFVDKKSDFAPKYESHKRLTGAYACVRAAIDGMTEDRLGEWASFLQECLKVIHVEAARESDAYAMFESINDRGVQLAQVDLIKTHLFKKAGRVRSDEIQRSWATIVDRMEETGSEELILLFFRHYWSSIHGLTREKGRELYRAIQGKVQNANAVYTLVGDLLTNANLYSAIVRPVPMFWKAYSPGEDAYNHIRTLESFNVDRYRPLLLSALRKWDKKGGKNVDSLLRFLVAWLARHLIVGELSSGTLEKAYCKYAVQIDKGDTQNFAQLRKEIQAQGNLVATDNQFEKQLRIASLAKAQLARYFLATLETAMREKTHPELVVNHDPNHVHLEHILPKKAGDPDWKAFNDEEKSEYLNRIGNLTLLSAPLNQSLQNGPYSGKKAKYRESELTITKNIPRDHKKWDVLNLEQRQAMLAAVAVKAWNIKG